MTTAQIAGNSPATDKFILHIKKEIKIAAPLAVSWAAMLEEIGPGLTKPDGTNLNMRLEPWPGGRYFRDTGNNSGHFWGHVQVIKPPSLLEITGPLFMSYAVMSHVQYRLTEEGRHTLLTLTHRAFGEIDDQHREGVNMGWGLIAEAIRKRAEK
ncbi:MAG: SRPBCC domain-containing protein [Tepidisphaera sp.]|nr:SRPBCC domain-containing protein [Tepidisphaera sp.]